MDLPSVPSPIKRSMATRKSAAGLCFGAFPLTLGMLLLLQLGCTKDPAALASPLTLNQAIIAGFAEPFLTLKHLGFIALVGPYVFTVSRQRLDPLWFSLLAFIACLLQYYGGEVPAISLAVALSVIAMLALQWTGAKFVRWSSPLILISGLLHGYDLGSQIPHGSFVSHAAYAFSFSLIMAILAYGIAYPAALLLAKSPEDYESLENLVTAIVSGIALVYLVWAFQG